MERGTVLAVNGKTQKIAVSVDGDNYAVFELADDYDVQVGHRMRGALESDECFALENLTTGEYLSVIPQGSHLPADQAKRAVDE